MPETINKKVYVSKENLQQVLEFLKTKNESLYLRKGAEAVSAAKVKNALTLTVGDTNVVFDGSEAKSAAVAAKGHKHSSIDINDFSGAVKKIVFGDENNQGTVTAHSHDNLTALNMVSEQYIKDWNAKIGVDDVARLKYNNAGVGGQTDVKTALDILIKNIQISNAALTDTTANVNGLAARLTQAEKDIDQAEKDIDALETTVNDAESGLVKKVANLEAANAEGGAVANAIKDAKEAAVAAQTTANQAVAANTAEVTRAQNAEAGLQNSINAINNAETGILKQAKDYTDGREVVIKGKITTAQNAAHAAQADVDALEGVVGNATNTSDMTTVFGKIAKVKEDLANEVTRADTAEKKAQAQADANKAAIETLNGADTVPGSVDNKIKTAINKVNTDASALEGRVKKNEDAIAVINGDGEGSIKKAVADLVDGAPEAMDTLKELAGAISAHQTVYEGYIQTVASNIATAKSEAISEAAKDAASKDSALKTELETAIGKKVDQTAYDAKVAALEKADTDNLEAAKKFAQDEDKKITDVIGTASDTLASTTVFGKIKLLQEKDAAQDQVINTKAAAADLNSLKTLVGEKTDTSTADTVFGAIAKEAARATVAEEALGGRIDTANGKITALENALDAEETGLKARMTAAETDIDNLQADMRTAQGDINNINTDITKIQNQLLNLVALTNDELDAMLNEVYN